MSGCSSNRSGRGERSTEGTIGHGACSQLARVEVRGFKTKKEGEGDREGRERKKEVKTRSVYTKKCSASDSRTG